MSWFKTNLWETRGGVGGMYYHVGWAFDFGFFHYMSYMRSSDLSFTHPAWQPLPPSKPGLTPNLQKNDGLLRQLTSWETKPSGQNHAKKFDKKLRHIKSLIFSCPLLTVARICSQIGVPSAFLHCLVMSLLSLEELCQAWQGPQNDFLALPTYLIARKDHMNRTKCTKCTVSATWLILLLASRMHYDCSFLV